MLLTWVILNRQLMSYWLTKWTRDWVATSLTDPLTEWVTYSLIYRAKQGSEEWMIVAMVPNIVCYLVS